MARRKRKKKKTALTPATNLKNKYISRVIIKQTSAITIKKKRKKRRLSGNPASDLHEHISGTTRKA